MKSKMQWYKKMLSIIPAPLRNQTYARIAFSAVFLFVFFIIACLGYDLLSLIPFATLSLFCFFSACHLFYISIRGDFVIIEGICIEKNVSLIKKKTKSITLRNEEHIVQVMMYKRTKKISIGETVTVYVAKNAKLFEQNGKLMLTSHISLKK